MMTSSKVRLGLWAVFLIATFAACGGEEIIAPGGGDRTSDGGGGGDGILADDDDDIGGGSGEYCDLSNPCRTGEECDYVNKKSGKCVTAGTAEHPEPWYDDETDVDDDDDDNDVNPSDDDDNDDVTSDDDDDDVITDDDDDDDVVDPCEGVVRECVSDTLLRRCKSDGSGVEDVDCSLSGYICHEGECKFCFPAQKYCIDAKNIGDCLADGSGVTPTACGDMQRCDPATVECVAAACNPGEVKCIDDKTMEVCNAEGTAANTQNCEGNKFCIEDVRWGAQCANLCEAAAASNSYVGCEYWPVNLSNSQLDPAFQAEYALVIGNTHERLDANIKVFKTGNVLVKEAVVKPRTTEVVYLPWNAMKAVSATNSSVSMKGSIAYKMTSDIPVTVYQFNPLKSAIGSTYSYTNDASLLLPAHIYSYDYVGMSYPHMSAKNIFSSADLPAYLAVVATSPGTTTVEITFRGYTASGTGISAHAPGEKDTFTLNQYEVLQLATRAAGSSSSAPGVCNGSDCMYYPEADLTGSLVKANNPIAVYGGTDCSLVPYNKMACDHMEEQLFPFSRWGHTYIGARSKPVGNGQGKDLWRIVAGVNGTSVRIDPPVPGVQTPFILNAGNRREFYHDGDFIIYSQDSDHPILVAQFLSGQDASNATVGDPSMILAAPIQQYRKDYLFLTPNTIAEDYANVIREKGVQVKLNDAIIPDSSFVQIGSSNYEVARGVQLPDGQSSLEATMPVGLVVYGYDKYVSYGYLGGLDLKTITHVQPGG
ncbi:MAG: hypothetical protein Kow0090_19440 [Myxococcota bacterium]